MPKLISNKPLSGFRILVVMPSIPLWGLELANIQIMRMMQEQGAEVLFAVNHEYGDRIIKALIEADLPYRKVRFHALWTLPRSLKAYRELFKSIGEIHKGMIGIYNTFKPDCIFMTGLSYLLYSTTWLLQIRRRVIFNVPNEPDLNINSWWKQRLNIAMWKPLASSFTRIFIANSDYTQKSLMAAGIQLRQVRRIYLTVPERPIQIAQEVLLPDKGINVVFIGQISRHKGVAELVKVAIRICHERSGVNFYLAGDIDNEDGFFQNKMADIENELFQERIIFPGRVENISGLLAHARIHVAPSLVEETFGMTVLEAKQAGIPSVVFPSGGMKETVSHEVDGYVCSEKSVGALYQGLMYYIDNAQRCNEHGKNAQLSLSRFSKKKISSEWVGLFKKEYQL